MPARSSTLTIIPAKGHSRRLPNKNRALLLGKPLVVHAIEQAIAAGVCGEICVGTDDLEIADLARAAGAIVPFLRREDVDEITPVGVAALNLLERFEAESAHQFDYVCLLLTTFPLRTGSDIAQCRSLLERHPEADAAMSFTETQKHPAWAWRPGEDSAMRPLFPDLCDKGRHELPRALFIDGAVYWARAPFFKAVRGDQYKGRVVGYEMPSERSVDVDTPFDLQLCEHLLALTGPIRGGMR